MMWTLELVWMGHNWDALSEMKAVVNAGERSRGQEVFTGPICLSQNQNGSKRIVDLSSGNIEP